MKFANKPGNERDALDADLQLIHDVTVLAVNMKVERYTQSQIDYQVLWQSVRMLRELGTYFCQDPHDHTPCFAQTSEKTYVDYRMATQWELFKKTFFGVISDSSYRGKMPKTIADQVKINDCAKDLELLRRRLLNNKQDLEAEDVESMANRLLAMGAIIVPVGSDLCMQWPNGFRRVLTRTERWKYKFFKSIPYVMYPPQHITTSDHSRKRKEESND